MKDLKSKVAIGIASSGFGATANKGLTLLTTIVLARLLSPEHFGIVAITTVVIAFIEVFNHIGLAAAVVQKLKLSQRQLSSCFYLSCLVSTVIFFFAFLFSASVGDFYDNQAATPIFQALSFTILINGFSVIHLAMLKKVMKFPLIASIEVLATLFQSVTTVCFALAGYEAWALVYGLLMFSVVKSAGFIVYSPWHPSLLFSLRKSMDLLKFGLSLTYTRITWFFYNKADLVIVGRLLSSNETGLYTMAMNLSRLPSNTITSLIMGVVPVVFAKLQKNNDELCKVLNQFSYGVAIISFPVQVGLILTAPEFIPIVLGEQWTNIVIPFQLISVFCLFKCVDPLLTQVLISTKHQNVVAIYTTLCAILLPVSVILGAIIFGTIGAAAAWAIVYPFLFGWLLWLTKKHAGMGVRKYFLSLSTPVYATIIMTASILLLSNLISLFFDLPLYLMFILKVAIGITSFVVFMVTKRSREISNLKVFLGEAGMPNKVLDSALLRKF